MPIDSAADMFRKMSQDFKVELLNDLKTRGTTAVADLEDPNLVGGNVSEVSIYKTGSFIDLCRGPHVASTTEIDPDSFRLTRVSGAYWRGNQQREQMQRVYGVAFDTKKELEDYFVRLEEAKKRDHRKLGQELDLFSINPDTVGGGLILWHPKGGLIRHIAEDYCKRKHLEAGYDFVYTPHIGRANLWETSGHLGFYAENMYAPIKIEDRKSTRLNSSHRTISYAVFCLKKKTKKQRYGRDEASASTSARDSFDYLSISSTTLQLFIDTYAGPRAHVPASTRSTESLLP